MAHGPTIPLEPAAKEPRRPRIACPSCSKLVENGSRFCNFCGHSFALGLRAPGGADVHCEECVYDVTGLNTGKCPECGALFGRARLRVNPTPDAAVRDALGRPLVAGLIACFVLLVLSMARRSGGFERVGLELLCLLVGAAVSTMLVWCAERVLDADDAPLWLTAARAAAAYAVVRIPAFVLLPLSSMRMGMVSTTAAVVVLTIAAFAAHWLWDEDSPQHSFARGTVVLLPAAGLFPLSDLLL
ncbi:MAG TPA: zinc ribbon domain-containing protein [Phycisphaerales bacterium]|nr:zinc ribbon domain-containing protein [Phycisphaerales bacterium]